MTSPTPSADATGLLRRDVLLERYRYPPHGRHAGRDARPDDPDHRDSEHLVLYLARAAAAADLARGTDLDPV